MTILASSRRGSAFRRLFLSLRCSNL